jgi:hypothetical protein
LIGIVPDSITQQKKGALWPVLSLLLTSLALPMTFSNSTHLRTSTKENHFE